MYCFAKLCRLCTKNINIASTIHTTDADEIQLKDKLLSIMPELVPVDEKLPTHVCVTCHERLKDAYDFKMQCLQSQDVLMSYLAQMKNVFIDGTQAQVTEISMHKYESNLILNIKAEDENLINIPTNIKQELPITSNEFLPHDDFKPNLCNLDDKFVLTAERNLSFVKELCTATENAEFLTNDINLYDTGTVSLDNDDFKKFVVVEEAQQLDTGVRALEETVSDKFYEEDSRNLAVEKTESIVEQVENDTGFTETAKETNELPNNTQADETVVDSDDTRQLRRREASKTMVQYGDDDGLIDEHEAMDDFDYSSSGSEFQVNSDDCEDSDDDFNMTIENKPIALRVKEINRFIASSANCLNNTPAVQVAQVYSNNTMINLNLVNEMNGAPDGISLNRTTKLSHEKAALNDDGQICKDYEKNNEVSTNKMCESNRSIFLDEGSEDCDDPGDHITMPTANIISTEQIDHRVDETKNNSASVKCLNNTLSVITTDDYSNNKMTQSNHGEKENDVSTEILRNSSTEFQSKYLYKIAGTNLSATYDPEEPTKFTLQHPIDADTKYVFIRNPILKQFLCKTCNIQLSDSATLLKHMKRHVIGNKISCEICNKRVYNMDAMQKHMVVHRTDRPFACTICEKKFKSKANLYSHMKSHNKSICCEYCAVLFANNTSLKEHIAYKHSQEKQYICSICGAAFKSLNGFRMHVLTHDKSIKYKCDNCNKVFGTKKGLRGHKRYLHTDPATWKHTCNICNKKFKEKCQLATHMHVHTGEKPHVCEHCGKAFRTKQAYTNHVRTHTGHRPFVCRVCDRGFTQSTSLAVHMRTHTGEKPYKCQECGKCYTQSYVYKQHVKKKHPKTEGSKEAGDEEQDTDQSSSS